MADSADESLKFLFSENRILYQTILSTSATSKSRWQIYCFNLVFSLNQGPKSDLPLPCLSDVLWSDIPLKMLPFTVKDIFMSKFPQVLWVADITQFQNRNIPPIC